MERQIGGSVRIMGIDESSLPNLDNPAYPEAQHEVIVNAYYEHIVSAHKELTESDSPVDLLILVPNQGTNSEWAQKALEKFHSETGIGYTDYTDKDTRRTLADRDKIRLCTFHSCRGLEGAHVLIFGFEQIEYMAKKLKFDIKKLGFIVLSRSIFSTTLVFRNFNFPPKHFIEKSLQMMHTLND